ncbi:hypothetical protein [Massilia yuzhufengensis]|uniref:Uncharacterized protein n=1 Tax=Massilia yuzhufengensis TaxID=1164594 RepID=A0A1I1KI79_9BURK|nr:hypothetical protein [Massilia yuzhufengensis]SFC60489.1 hypothetical protein SAMN05216204_1087 [Massilia yuzhufengensis]
MPSIMDFPLPQLLNLAAHIGAGIAAICLGMAMLAGAKGTPTHRSRGRLFAALTLAVCGTAIIGNVFFRFVPVFAVLTVLVTYQLLSGWHVVYTKAAGPNRFDALLGVCAAAWTIGLVPVLLAAGDKGGAAPPVIHASLGALAFLLAYDAARWCFPTRWHASLWRVEHIYKLVASLFGMLSAAVGNLVRVGQPWSQLLPSVLGMLAIALFIWRELRLRRRAASAGAHCAVASE